MINVHATLVSYRNKGILLIGPSGSGKSDLALRMITDYSAKLVADDRVNLYVRNNSLYGSAPKEIFNKIEIRNVGIANVAAQKHSKVSLCVELCLNRKEIDRLPYPEYIDFLGISVEKIRLYPFDCSTICKIIAKISGIIS